MRNMAPFGFSLLAAALAFAAPAPASAQTSQTWDICVSTATGPDDRISACSAIIDARSESGKRLAAAYCNRGHGFTEKRELDRALADLDEALRIDAAYPCALSNRGRVYAFKRDLDRAIADYTTVIKLAPDVLAYINRGNAYRDSEQLDRAAADYAAAIKLAPTDARGWRNRGMIRLFQGDNKGGIADYDKALQYDPADVYSWNNRGQAKLRVGDKQGAIADFRKALQLRPDLDTARESLQRLGAAK